jgi:hypothetical protein
MVLNTAFLFKNNDFISFTAFPSPSSARNAGRKKDDLLSGRAAIKVYMKMNTERIQPCFYSV